MAEMFKRGKFIAIEGIDGCGKTAVGDYLAEKIREVTGDTVERARDPGTLKASEKIREILLDKDIPIDPWQQALLYMAARRGLSQKIDEGLWAGTHYVVDRWFMSTYVYQGLLGHLSIPFLWKLYTEVIGLDPYMYIFLDVDPEVGIRRKIEAAGGEAGLDRFESKDVEWRSRLAHNYRLTAARFPSTKVINANISLDEVKAAAWAAVAEYF